ncbi:MAG: PqqD family protein [Elusimicrobia bacterium]|nr:PqqD family protein [Elusimicrobiota bacterium]
MRPAKRLAFRVLCGRAFIVDPKAARLHTLNGIGTRIWELAERRLSPAEIGSLLAGEFDVSVEEAGRDAAVFLEKLRVMGLLEE